MRRIFGLLMVSMICLFCGCAKTLEDGQPVQGIQVNSVSSPEPIGDPPCTYRYTLLVSEGGDHSSTYCYWPAIARKEGDNYWVVAHGEGVSASPSFTNLQLQVDLNWDDAYSPGDVLYAMVVEATDCDHVGDALDYLTWDNSDGPVQFSPFDQDCYPFSIALSVDGEDIVPNECVYIDEYPQMPTMEARVANGQVAGSAVWKLVIEYTRSRRTDRDEFTSTLPPSATWYINNSVGSLFRGGMATVTCESSVDPNYKASFVFWIRALNPYEYDAEDYINARPNALWYYKLVARHEGDSYEGRWYLQFNEKEPAGGEECNQMGAIKHTPNWGDNSENGGFGMYQLDNFTINGQTRGPNAQELWNWKENVNTGSTLLSQHQSGANDYLFWQRFAARACGCSDIIPDIPVGDDGIILRDAPGCDKIAEHGVAMKRYNGVGSYMPTEFCAFNPDDETWNINRYAYYVIVIDGAPKLTSNKYVDDVCSEVQ